ncbi:HEPN domain-containing protein [Rubneribacter sp.]|nr:HEPN domain-containing protein [Candidatus Rubneribacter avistercoris]
MASPIYTGFMYAASKDALAVNALVQASIQDHSEAIAFHCQQAAEKMVKAVFTENGQVPPKSHDIGDLLSTAIEQAWLKASQPAIQAAIDLTLYAVAARYETTPDISIGEATKAIKDCNFVATMLADNGYEYVTVHTEDAPEANALI